MDFFFKLGLLQNANMYFESPKQELGTSIPKFIGSGILYSLGAQLIDICPLSCDCRSGGFSLYRAKCIMQSVIMARMCGLSYP